MCLSLDNEADLILSGDYHAREVSIEEGLEILKGSHEAGLVHMAYVMEGHDKPGLICSCCSCCCHTLGGLLRYGIHTKVLTSKYMAIDDEMKCIACGKCVSRCVFDARSLFEGKLVYNKSKCYGCGLCLSKCPTQTIKMKQRVK